MDLKAKYYKRLIGVIMSISLIIDMTSIQSHAVTDDTSDYDIYTDIICTDYCNQDAGISKMIHDIEITPIYQDESSEVTNNYIDVSNYYFELTGYISVNTELNVRKEPNKDSEIISTLNWMDEVNYSVVNDDWLCIKINDNEYGFISSDYITSDKENYSKSYQVTGDKAKTYMDYRKITDKRSDQYKLQLRASTNTENGLRLLRDRYMVAVGSYFGCSIGQYIDVVLSDGEVLKCIVGDAKKDIHTDSQNLHGLNGDTVEFIVDSKILKATTDVVGNISDVSDVFDGKVVEIRRYNHIER